jgi:hypothetical protein
MLYIGSIKSVMVNKVTSLKQHFILAEWKQVLDCGTAHMCFGKHFLTSDGERKV